MNWRPPLLTAGLAMTACSLNLPEVVHDDAGGSSSGGSSADGGTGGTGGGGTGGTSADGGTGGTSADGGTGGTSADGGTGGTSADGGTGGTSADGGTGGTAGTGAGGTAGNPCPNVEQLVSTSTSGGFALDADNVYIGLNVGGPMRCAKAGCGGVAVELNGPMDSSVGIAASGTQLYVRDAGGALWSCTTPDCTSPVQLAFPSGLDNTGIYRNLFADGSGVYAWADDHLVRFPPSAPPCALASVSHLTSAIVTVGSKVAYTYAADYPYDETMHTIESVPIDCPTSGLHTPTAASVPYEDARSIAAYGSTLYWISDFGILSCDLNNCESDFDFAPKVDGILDAVIADAEAVYWVTDKTISRCDHSGCGPDGPQVLACRGCASMPTGAAKLALDDDYIYLRCDGVFRASKR